MLKKKENIAPSKLLRIKIKIEKYYKLNLSVTLSRIKREIKNILEHSKRTNKNTYHLGTNRPEIVLQSRRTKQQRQKQKKNCNCKANIQQKLIRENVYPPELSPGMVRAIPLTEIFTQAV